MNSGTTSAARSTRSRRRCARIRRDLHAHPEFGFEETRTAAIVAAYLRGCGLDVTEEIGGTGVVGTLRGRQGNRTIGFRADMDALKIVEDTGLPHASTSSGMMHACGHDGHTTMLLGAARILSRHRDFSGTIHFVFQPAEEGLGGAPAMMRDGLFTRFPMDVIFGLHNKPGFEVGTFHINPGPMLAAADTFTVRFKGQGGHGGSGAHLSVDTTMAAAQFITTLQAIIGRNVAATDAAVISVGHIAGGSAQAANVIPAEVTVIGTVRSHLPATRALLERRLREVAASAADCFGTELGIDYAHKFPPTINDAEVTARAIAVAGALTGAENVETTMRAGMGAEDFAYMMEKVPGAFMFIGNGHGAALHTNRYDFNDDIMPTGIQYWVRLAQTELGS